MKKILTLLCSMLLYANVANGVTIFGRIIGDERRIEYYKPFKGFGNYEIQSYLFANKQGEFKINLKISHTSLTKISIGDNAIWLVIEPKDTLQIVINLFKKNNWLTVNGKNRAGHLYFNINLQNHNFFEKLRKEFALVKYYNEPFIVNKLNLVIKSELKWLDSLYTRRLISNSYRQIIYSEISGLIAWEAVNLSNKLNQDKTGLIKEITFKIIDPLNVHLKFCMRGHSYYDSYFRERSANTIIENKEKILIDEVAYIELAPHDLREYLWGRAINIYYKLAPGMYDYCRMYKIYKKRYTSNEIISHLDSSRICTVVLNKFKIIETSENNVINLIMSNLPNRRVFVDLWATWCIPCIKEFSNYNEELYNIFNKYKITPVFISLDKENDKKKWEMTLQRLNLAGYHILSNELLTNSINEIIYNNKIIELPRYVIINEKSQIINNNSPRPSSPEFKKLLENVFPLKDDH